MTDEVKINDQELENVDGGATNWANFAKGKYVRSGNAILYTIAAGDALSGIAIRFGVTIQELQLWNDIKNPNLIYAGNTLTIYPRTLR